MKKEYTEAVLEILSFNDEDIIVTSGEGNNETPKMPWNSTRTAPNGEDPGAKMFY